MGMTICAFVRVCACVRVYEYVRDSLSDSAVDQIHHDAS